MPSGPRLNIGRARSGVTVCVDGDGVVQLTVFARSQLSGSITIQLVRDADAMDYECHGVGSNEEDCHHNNTYGCLLALWLHS